MTTEDRFPTQEGYVSVDQWLCYNYPIYLDSCGVSYRRIDSIKEPYLGTQLFRQLNNALYKNKSNTTDASGMYAELLHMCTRGEYGPWLPAPVLAFRKLNKKSQEPTIRNILNFLQKYIYIFGRDGVGQCDITEHIDCVHVRDNETIVSLRCSKGGVVGGDASVDIMIGNSVYGCSLCRSSKSSHCPTQWLVYKYIYRSTMDEYRVAYMETIFDNGESARGVRLQKQLCFENQTDVECVRIAKERQHPPDVASTKSAILPPKLLYVSAFLTADEAEQLKDMIDGQAWCQSVISRRVQHYGVSFVYENMSHAFDAGCIPAFLRNLGKRCYDMGYIPDEPDQFTINEYLPGQGIGYHIDVHESFTSWVATVSLNSGCVFEFRKRSETGDHKPPSISRLMDESPTKCINYIPPKIEKRKYIYLEAGSLAVFSDELRYAWEHGIAGRSYDIVNGIQIPRGRRISVTMRKYKSDICPCKFDYFCDDRNSLVKMGMKPTHLKDVESK